MRAALLALPFALLLSGCANLQNLLSNRVTVPLALDECRVDSRWAGFGISTEIDPRDCEVILEAMRLRALQQAVDRAAGKGQKI